jgi:putative DNA primase/helicase
MTAAEIAAALGSPYRSGQWWRCRCPVHGSRGATLALRDGGGGLIAVCHAGCSRIEILAELRRRRLIIGYIQQPAPSPREARDDDARRRGLARCVWDFAQEARGAPLVAYLAARGITVPTPRSLRWARSLRRLDGSYAPAMVARVDDLEGRLIGVHRTWIDRDAAGRWRRRDRGSLGPIGGGAVRLAPVAETLMVAEGIETALSAMQATETPAWAALSTSGLVALVLPPVIRSVTILVDNDSSRAGERAARTAAARWLAEGRRVKLAMPLEVGSDFNDLLIGHAYAEARNVTA